MRANRHEKHIHLRLLSSQESVFGKELNRHAMFVIVGDCGIDEPPSAIFPLGVRPHFEPVTCNLLKYEPIPAISSLAVKPGRQNRVEIIGVTLKVNGVGLIRIATGIRPNGGPHKLQEPFGHEGYGRSKIDHAGLVRLSIDNLAVESTGRADENEERHSILVLTPPAGFHDAGQLRFGQIVCERHDTYHTVS